MSSGKVRLISPQHWAQTQSKHRSDRRKCEERTDGDSCTLYWNFGTSERTIDLGHKDNVATFSLAPGFANFVAFCCEAELFEPLRDPIALPAGIISDRSPLHGQSVALILDRDTGLVSPQFHVAYDAAFDTVKDITSKAKWLLRAGFVT